MTDGTALEGLGLDSLGVVICYEHFLEFCVKNERNKGFFFWTGDTTGDTEALAPPSASLISHLPTSHLLPPQHPHQPEDRRCSLG